MLFIINLQHHYRFDLDLIDEDLPGEMWNTVPGFSDYYLVSSYGRVRSVDRIIPHPRLVSQFVKGRILSQKVIRHRNIKTNLPSIDLQVSLSMNGKSTYHNVRRLVYAAFIDPHLDYNTNGKYVINVDGNGFNCQVNNLRLVTKAEKSQRAFDRKRVIESNLKTADRSKWTRPYGGAARRKPVLQYDLKGQMVSRFESISQAAKITGYGEKEIILVAKGKWKQYRGFNFKYDQ